MAHIISLSYPMPRSGRESWERRQEWISKVPALHWESSVCIPREHSAAPGLKGSVPCKWHEIPKQPLLFRARRLKVTRATPPAFGKTKVYKLGFHACTSLSGPPLLIHNPPSPVSWVLLLQTNQKHIQWKFSLPSLSRRDFSYRYRTNVLYL